MKTFYNKMLPFLFIVIKCFISLIAVYIIVMLIAFATNTPVGLMTLGKLSSNEMMDIIMQNVFLIITFYFLLTYTFRVNLKYSFKLASIFCILYVPLSYYFLGGSYGYFVGSLIGGSLTVFFAFPVILILVFDIFNYKKNQSKNLDSKLIHIWALILSIVIISVFIIRMLYLIG